MLDAYRHDFWFLMQYKKELPGELQVRYDEEVTLLYCGHKISTISMAVTYFQLRQYKVTMFPEFVPAEFVEEEGVQTEEDNSYSIVIGPELLHCWCHKLIWCAIEVIGYKRLH